jgi:hypothetical protein
MKLKINKNQIFIISLAILPILIVFFKIIVNHTISYANNGMGAATWGINALPILDPSAGTHQDEPWLYFIRKSILDLSWPLVNQYNGLGAPMLTSMQSGALYPLNIILIAIPAKSSQFFDIFSFLHVLILCYGVYLLSLEFANNKINAAIIASSVATSLFVIYNINMVHFRAFVWMPIMIYAMINCLKNNESFRWILLYWSSIIFSFTAGNPQESIFNFLVGHLIIILYVYLHKDLLSIRLLILPFIGLVFAMVGVLPYLLALSAGDIWSVSSINRSDFHTGELVFSTDFLIPRFTGFPGAIWVDTRKVYELIPAIPPVIIASLIGLKYLEGKSKLVVYILIGITILWISKLFNIGYWGWVKYIPFFNEIRYTKYILSIIIIFVPICAICMEAMQRNFIMPMKSIIKPTIFLITALLIILLLGISSSLWRPLGSFQINKYWVIYITTFFLYIGVLPYLITLRRDSGTITLTLATICLFSIFMAPAGFGIEGTYNKTIQNDAVTFQPENHTDENWDRGIRRHAPGFFTNNSQALRQLSEGDTLLFSNNKKRKIISINGAIVNLDGTEPLDPYSEGFPHQIKLDQLDYEVKVKAEAKIKKALESGWPRVVDNVNPNLNLLSGSSSPWVFDPIMNRRYRDLIVNNFQVHNPGFDTKPNKNTIFSNSQIDILRMLGVGYISDYDMSSNPHYKKIATKKFVANESLLPQGVILENSQLNALEELFLKGKYGEFVDLIRKNGQEIPVKIEGSNKITINSDFNLDNKSILINRVYDSAWISDNGDTAAYADFWLIVKKPVGKLIEVEYRPKILLNMFIIGLLIILTSYIIFRRLYIK